MSAGTILALVGAILLVVVYMSRHNENSEAKARAAAGRECFNRVKFCTKCGRPQRVDGAGKCSKCGASSMCLIPRKIGFRDVDNRRSR